MQLVQLDRSQIQIFRGPESLKKRFFKRIISYLAMQIGEPKSDVPLSTLIARSEIEPIWI
jgi:hypothetical protein